MSMKHWMQTKCCAEILEAATDAGRRSEEAAAASRYEARLEFKLTYFSLSDSCLIDIYVPKVSGWTEFG